MATGFGTPCEGGAAREFWHRMGAHWFDADGIPTSPHVRGILAAPGIVVPKYLDAVTFDVQVSNPDCDVVSSLAVDVSSLPAGNDAMLTPSSGNEVGTFSWHPTATDFGEFSVTFTATGPNAPFPPPRTTVIHLVSGVPAAVETSEERPELALLPNRPNPLNPSTVITYSVPGQTHVRLVVYDLSGRVAARLVDRVETPGFHEMRWSGVDDRGRPLASGVYWCRLTTAFGTRARPLVLAR